ncbi:ATP-binding protein [Dactylosporangium sp. AC04546]|uniref:ATP-binding protein n=1 Tax=Dactylosporangium sp. AC04546 TaxID=2862460 RepID=UPI001EDF6462|nr:ATP-binding protein [Dactylosporangium sp. AC04546]WVK80429.1 ATP-binding protein [Dactylosporangium sp. AC04546]
MTSSWLRGAEVSPHGDVHIAEQVHHHYAVSAGAVPLVAVRQDPSSVLIDIDVERFVGRAWVLARIDAFMASRRCGFVWIEAAAGLGKTSVAAHLVAHRGWLSHFARRGESSTRVRTALRSLAAQVIEAGELRDEIAPQGYLPEWVQEPEGFANLLALAASRIVACGGQLVLVVDGLDEADRVAGGLPLGLPGRLPAGVFVIGTYRTGSPPGRTDSPKTVITIGAKDPANTADVIEFLTRVAGEEVIAGKLAEAGVTRDQFVDQLAQRCSGVWVYLRYVLAEIRHGIRGVDRLDALPADLWDYYTDNLDAWQARPDWLTVGAPVLTALAAAREPVTASTLCRWIAGDLAPVRRWCDFVLRPFLAVARNADPRSAARYSIYHASMRELLHGDAAPDGAGDAHRPWAETLHRATTDAHFRIIDGYLALFGGAPAELISLSRNLGLAATDDGYALRHLVAHLAHTDRWTDIRQLLLGSITGDGHLANVWYQAHDTHDSIDNYLDDLNHARRHAAECVDADLAAGGLAATLADEIWYGLVAASIHSLTNNISSDLLEQLVSTSMWLSIPWNRGGLRYAA